MKTFSSESVAARPPVNIRARRLVSPGIVLVLFLAAPRLLSLDFPPLEADSKAVEYGRRAGTGLSWEDLAEMSVWASGAADPFAPAARGRPSYMDTIREAAAELREGIPRDEREQGEYILDFMFKNYLKRYSHNQTRLDTLLTNGNYNCVSSAVFYVILAEAAGLDVRGVITRDHVFVKLVSPGGEIDVETTNRYGFDPGNRKDFHDGFGRTTGFVYVPAKNYRDRADIGHLELVSLIFSNRITELESRNRFAEAVSLALDREALLSSLDGRTYPELFPEPGKMVADRLSNYGAALIRQGKNEEALQWADLAASSRPDDTRWDELAAAALNNLVAKLASAKRFSEARELIASNANRAGPLVSAKLDSMREIVSEAEFSSLAASARNMQDIDSALEVFRRNSLGVAAEKVRELSVFLMLKKAELIAKEQGWQDAIACIRAASAEYGGDRRFDEHLRAFTANRIAELHNSFAAAFNRDDYERAETIIRTALEEFPGNSRLLRDKSLIESQESP